MAQHNNYAQDRDLMIEAYESIGAMPSRSEEEVDIILNRLRKEHTAETIDELIHYGGLRDLLLYGEGDGPLSVEDAMHQAHMNS
jgi:hypothetical protein